MIPPARIPVLRTELHPTSYEGATDLVASWAAGGESRYVCAANVHMVMEGFDDPSFQEVVNQADLATPDGMPLVWMMRRLGSPNQQRVYGPSLMIHICRAAEAQALSIGLLGGKEETASQLRNNLLNQFPKLNIGFALCPPFRPLSAAEDQALVQNIHQSGVKILFVGLGCPKQEKWMAAHRGIIPAVMVGVGAAFDFHAGTVAQAPQFLQKTGLEWFFRLAIEPRRLWRRYLIHNPRFLWHAARQLLGI